MPRRIRIELPEDLTNDAYADIAEAVRELLDGMDELPDFYVRTDRGISAAAMSERYPHWERLQGRSKLE
jgi:hypothetical protein